MVWSDCYRLREENKCRPHMSPCTKLGNVKLLKKVFGDPRLIFNIEELNINANWLTAHEALS
jgi:hypothetical protein